MRTFFFALVLGIFIGALATSYQFWPDSFKDLFPGSEPAITEEGEPQDAAHAYEKSGDPEISQPGPVESIAQSAKDVWSDTTEAAPEKLQSAVSYSKDLTISITLRSKFKLDGDIESADVDYDVEDGKVTLFGMATSKDNERHIIEVALDTKGVKEVESKLKIKD